CKEGSEKGIYVIEQRTALGCSVVLDCPDYNSIQLKNRERAREIWLASDVILFVISGESAFEERTVQFFEDVHQGQKLVVPVTSRQMGGGQARELIDAFREELDKERGIDWEPRFGIAVGNLRKEQLDDPSPEYCKKVDGIDRLDLADPGERARIKFRVLRDTCQKAVEDALMELRPMRQKARMWCQVEERIESELEQASEDMLEQLFPMGEMLKVVEDQMVQQMGFFSRKLYQHNPARVMSLIVRKTWDVTSSQVDSIVRKAKALGKGGKEAQEIKQEAEQAFREELKVPVGELLEALSAEVQRLESSRVGIGTDELMVSRVLDDIEDFQRQVVEGSMLTDAYEEKIREKTEEWWDKQSFERKWGVKMISALMSVAIPVSLVVAAAIPGIGVAEGVLVAVLTPQVVGFLKTNIGFITPIKEEWIQDERQKLVRWLRRSICDEFDGQLGHWKDVEDRAEQVTDAAETTKSNLKGE
ncbi:MAG: hypothetical protein ACOC2T_03850, partial [Planctomycetota bacterium]